MTCDFKSGKVILQQPVAREQMTKLLATGKTDLLEGFVSNKTRRKFKARLAWDAKEGKVVFVFEPRPERKAGGEEGGRRGEVGGGGRAGREPCRRRSRRSRREEGRQERAGKKSPAAKAAASRRQGRRDAAERGPKPKRLPRDAAPSAAAPADACGPLRATRSSPARR